MSIWRVLDRRVVPAAVLAVVVASGCGGGAGSHPGGSEAARARPAACQVGAPALPHVPAAPASWRDAARPAIALSCSADPVDSGAAIVGYGIPGGGACVSAYSARLREAFGELCEPPGSEWLAQCEGPGCVHYFRHDRNDTVLDGPAEPATAEIRILVGRKPLLEGVMHADVQGRRFGRIGAEEPFDFFAAYIPRCVEPGRVRVELIDARGEVLGTADRWDVEVPRCPRSG